MSIGRIVGGRYELLERIGSGAFFQVFKARDRLAGRFVAVKVLLPEVQSDAAFREALVDAMQAVHSLVHPNIAGVYEVVTEDDCPVVVTEYVRGINLRERISRIAPFTVSIAVDFAVGICDALQYAHSDGVLHGDLRPANVIVSPEGVVKVTDFGVARAIAASRAATARNESRVAPYVAPEAAASGILAASADVYALGAVLFEMLTARPPYPADTPVQIALRHQHDPVPSPREINAGVPRALDGIVRKALQKQPDDRYHSAYDMLADLRKVRDALRFGRPLTWSPMGDAATPQTVVKPEPAPPVRETVLAPEKPMPTPRRDTNGLAPFLRWSLSIMAIVVALLAFLGIGLWLSSFTRPEEKVFPDLVGKSIEEARTQATRLRIHLIEREEYNDSYDPGTVFRVDYEPGRPIRPGRAVLIWVSKGSRLVWVPNVTGLGAPEAEAKLKEAGLTLGQVDRRTSDDVPYGFIMSQNPRSGKRVERDTPVNLVVSDGPSEGGSGASTESGSESAYAEHEWNIRHTVRRDGKGPRQVRIEYEDTLGTATVFDEVRNEGDTIEVQVRAQGPSIVVRVYYSDDPVPVSERTVPWRRRR